MYQSYIDLTQTTPISTSGQSNLTPGRIAAAYGRFNDIRQVVPVCTAT